MTCFLSQNPFCTSFQIISHTVIPNPILPDVSGQFAITAVGSKNEQDGRIEIRIDLDDVANPETIDAIVVAFGLLQKNSADSPEKFKATLEAIGADGDLSAIQQQVLAVADARAKADAPT
jgi:hypothetical protein